MKIYNSLSKSKEKLITIQNDLVKMYTCGPTVYYYPHIGNMRAYIFMDSLRRILKYNGYKINGVMNITDVGHLTSDADEGEDKMELSAKRENKSPYEIAEFYTNIFLDAMKKLNIDMPEHITKATEYIDKMISFIELLESKGYTYLLDDGLYFDISKFDNYGRLSEKDISLKGVGRIEENSNKHHPFDFALWKKVPENHIMKWDSPWGVGCPGWHIECSAMACDILGNKFDIHTGGIDHKPVHHENEIAQNDAAMGHQVVNYWMHCEFLQVDGGKMSKSLNNIYTIEDLEAKGYSALDFKYFCLNSNYRKTINFTFEGLDSASMARKNLKKMLLTHKNSDEILDENLIDEYKNKFLEAINDDLNTPLALGILWTLIKESPSKNIYDTVIEFDKVFALELDKEEHIAEDQVPTEILKLANDRWDAKKNKNFALSDDIRDKIIKLGYNVKDTRDGFEIEKI